MNDRPLSQCTSGDLVALLRRWMGGVRMGDEPSVLEIVAEVERRFVKLENAAHRLAVELAPRTKREKDA
jgi:hypothetical protein